MNGFIYVMSNPIFSDNRIKIGKSKSDPSSLRKDELYSTGVPEPFKVEYYAFVEDYDKVEIKIHRILDHKRPNKNREFFTSSIPEAILTIKQNSKVKYEEVFYKSPHEIEVEKRKQFEERKRQEHIEKVNEQERIKREQEDQRRQRLQEENNRLEWEKKKKDYKNLIILIGKSIILFGSAYYSILFLEFLEENKINTTILITLVILLIFLFLFFLKKITSSENKVNQSAKESVLKKIDLKKFSNIPKTSIEKFGLILFCLLFIIPILLAFIIDV